MEKKQEQAEVIERQSGPIAFPGDGRPKPGEEPVPTVRMVRDPDYGPPDAADVHPDEVANWQAGGWVIDDAA